ncbi:FixH family protein [Faunimonas sp. B44]|uniref:FixH family protein n=1 Tax=Faunimonas sp. B44 TaxID=3461493 RepID=UPI00404461DE
MTRIIRFFRLNDDNPFTGWHMLGVTGCFFGTIIAVNLVMAFAATGTFPGLAVKNSYTASQDYNGLLAAAREQEQAGWSADLAVEAGLLRFALRDAAGAAQPGLAVTAHVGRPGSEAEDRLIDFAAVPGGYAAPEPLAAGRWEVDVEAHRDGTLLYRETREVFVPQTDGAP